MAGSSPAMTIEDPNRSVAQLVEHRSPKPGVGGSSPSTPAMPPTQDYIIVDLPIHRLRSTGPTEVFRSDMAKTTATEFVQQVRQELTRITWPTRKETLVTTAMVFVMVFVAAIFFFVVDQALSYAVRFLFGLGQ